MKIIEIERMPNASSLYIFFGGIASGIAMPPFEFYNASKIINENKMFLRDFSQCWYNAGINSACNDIFSTAKFVEKQIEDIDPKRVVFVGNSMGGFAAILFATLIGYGEVIAFAPQTFISPFLRFKHGDQRWRRKIVNTYIRSLFKKKVWNIRPYILKKKKEQKISIFVSMDDRLDYIHALYLKDIDGVKIFKFRIGGHNIVKILKDDGKLADIMYGNYG